MRKKFKDRLISLGTIDTNPSLKRIGNLIPSDSSIMMDTGDNKLYIMNTKTNKEGIIESMTIICLTPWDRLESPKEGIAIEVGYNGIMNYGPEEQS